ncbi:MAG: Stf0 family sulfotransferase [Pseudomonadota bacterium]
MKLTLVLANQRSGSTLLCQDIASLGGMGVPSEHFIQVVGKGNDGVVGADRIRALAALNAPGDVAAVKLMVNYASTVDNHIHDRDQLLSPAEACRSFITWARETYDRVNLVVIIRENVIDQAISRFMAETTGVYHSWDLRNGEAYPDIAEKLKQERSMWRLIDLCVTLLREKRTLCDTAAEHSDIGRLFTYESVVDDLEGTSEALRSLGVSNGMTPERQTAVRRLKKVVSDETADKLRTNLANYLQRELLPHLSGAGA